MSGKTGGENMWRLPLPSEYRKLYKSDIADFQNTGGRGGGAITAGLMLQEFVPDEIPWAHIDIAGPSNYGTRDAYIPKGASGFGVRTLVNYILSLE